ncbi:MAG: hypothetical protein AAF703_02650 [Cyanobacteria bacterium P01_D01_bin.105]
MVYVLTDTENAEILHDFRANDIASRQASNNGNTTLTYVTFTHYGP